MVSILIKNHLLETMQTLLMTNEKNDASKRKKMVTERSGVCDPPTATSPPFFNHIIISSRTARAHFLQN